MKIIVFGAGAIGSIYAAKLAAHHDVTIIGRAAHVDAIKRDGLHIRGREELKVRLKAATEIEQIEPSTLILLTSKVHDNRAAALTIADQVRHDTLILCVQNGLRSEEIVRQVLDNRCVVLRAITQFGAIFAGPGLIDLKVTGETLIERHERSEELAALLTKSGLETRISE
ncbi:MAG TPA: 2-dehydropantoate 2-reductase N-terminal domain-containing protein, partial [Verrucomicrobiae bacterium]|nr:2-dehydropantoate 2-reductase N-terminal domain-containing protein [Verrucomicrobiae bacterium]